MDNVQKQKLIEAFLACPTMRDRHTRDAVVNDLPDDIRDNIHRSSTNRADVNNIVASCLDYFDGLDKLIEIVRFYENNSKGMQQLDLVRSGITDLDVAPKAEVTNQVRTEGLVSYSPIAVVQNILDRYNRLPFGGREDATRSMKAFLHERRSGYVFVTSPSGFGKTALLSNFIARASESQNLSCVYYLLSRRDNTSNEIDCLQALCRQLVRYYKWVGSLPNTVGELRTLYADLLKLSPDYESQPLVIVLDGLDEAEGWTPSRIIFPAELPQGVFVFFSARQVADKDWLAELELSHEQCEIIILGPLERDEIVKIFCSAGGRADEWIKKDAFLNNVMRVSGGDPFYIQCLLEDIREGRITPSNIANQPKDLEKYLNHWWQEIEDKVGVPEVEDLLGYLAVARGPLARVDLLEIDPDDALTGSKLGQTLSMVRRFVVGDEQAGYVLCHPRFQEYVAGRFAGMLAQYEAKLLDYCRVVWRKGSAYSLRHLTAHLFQIGSFGELQGLINRDFVSAKRRKFGSHRSFIDDLERAIQTVEAEGINGLPRLMSYSLLCATLGSLATNVTPEVLRVLVEWRQVERAIGYAEMIVEPEQRAAAFQAIGGGGFTANLWEMWGEKRPKLEGALLKRAFEEALYITDVEKKAHCLYSLAPELARAGEAEAALVAAEQIDQEWPDKFDHLKREALAKIPVELARVGKTEEALAAIERVDEKYHRKSNILHDITVALAEAGKIREALEIAMAVQETEKEESYLSRTPVLKRIASICQMNSEILTAEVERIREVTDAQEKTKALEIINKRVEEARHCAEVEYQKYEKEHKSSKEREEKVENLIWLGKYDDVLQILKEIEFTDLRQSGIYKKFIESLLVSNRFEDAQILVEKALKSESYLQETFDEIERWETHWRAIKYLITKGQVDDALVAIKQSGMTLEAILMLGLELAREGKIEAVISIFKENEDNVSFEMKVPSLVAHLARAGMFIEAEKLSDRLLRYDDYFLFQAFTELAGALAGAGRLNHIVPTAERLIRNIPKRCEVLAKVAIRLAAVDKQQASEVLEGALINAENIEGAYSDLAEVLAAIIITLAALGKLESAVSIASEKFGKVNPEVWAEIKAEFIYRLTEADKAQGHKELEKLLASTKQIEDDTGLLFSQKQAMLECLVRSLARRNQFESAAMVAAEIIDGSWYKLLALVQLAGRLAAVDTKQAKVLLSEALKMGQKLGKVWEARSLRGEMWSSFFPSLAEAEGHVLWIAFGMQEFMGSGLGYDEVEALIAIKLLKTGWIEETLTIAHNLKQRDIRDQIQTYAAVALANKGEVEKAQILAKKLPKTSVIIQTIIQRLLGEERPNEARQLVENLQDIEDETKAELLGEIVLSFARKGQLAETQETIVKIPSKSGYKLMTQLSLVLFYAHTDKLADAETIAEGIEDNAWKSFAKVLIEINVQNVEEEERSRQFILLLEKTLAMFRLVNNDVTRSWLLINAAVMLAAAGRLEEVLAETHEILEWDTRFQTLAEVAVQFVSFGLVEDAFAILEEIKNQKIKTQSIAKVAHELGNIVPEQALRGIQLLLQSTRMKGRRSTCEIIAQVVPPIAKLVGSERGIELTQEAYDEIMKVESWGIVSTG